MFKATMTTTLLTLGGHLLSAASSVRAVSAVSTPAVVDPDEFDAITKLLPTFYRKLKNKLPERIHSMTGQTGATKYLCKDFRPEGFGFEQEDMLSSLYGLKSSEWLYRAQTAADKKVCMYRFFFFKEMVRMSPFCKSKLWKSGMY